jgi:hypothetical protein
MKRCPVCQQEPIPDGFQVCAVCDVFADEEPMLPVPLTREDVRLNSMDYEAADYTDVFGTVERRFA